MSIAEPASSYAEPPTAGKVPGWLVEAFALMDTYSGHEDTIRPPVSRPRVIGSKAVASALSMHGGLVDRVLLKVMTRFFESSDKPDIEGNIRARIEAFCEQYARRDLIDNPALFFRPTPMPESFRVKTLGRLKGGRRLRVTFPSTYTTHDTTYQEKYSAFRRNQMNRVHLFQHDTPHRPTAICIHAWGGGNLVLEERIFAARTLYKMGLNVALMTMPLHGARTPKSTLLPGQLFPSRDLRRSNEAFCQAVADLRVLRQWLGTAQASGPVGYIGISLGGYTAALMASLESDAAFIIPIVAPCSFGDLMWHHGSNQRSRHEIEERGVSLWDIRRIFALHCPLLYPLKVPKENVLILWGEGDRVVSSLQQWVLWEHWGQPQIESFAGGHVMHFGRRQYLRVITKWLRERL
jgi:hypothetical protein